MSENHHYARLSEKHLLEKSLDSQQVYAGKLVNVRCDTVLLPNGKEALREVVEHPGAVAVVPVTDEGKIVLVRQYRHPVAKTLLEIPAGKLNAKEDPQECALRELAEETGFSAKSIKKLASIYTTPGFTNEIIHIYFAEKMTRGVQQPDEDEFLNVEEYTPDQIKTMIKKSVICDAKSILGLALAGIEVRI